MNITKLAGIGITTTLAAGMGIRHLYSKENDYTNVDVFNERNRAWLCDEPCNYDKFEKKEVDLNKEYLCSNEDDYHII